MTGFEIEIPLFFNNPSLPVVPLYGFSDNFNRANSPTLGVTSGEHTPWERMYGLNAMGGQISGNRVIPNGISGVSAAWGVEAADAHSADGVLKATLAAAGELWGGLAFRVRSNLDFLQLTLRASDTNFSLVLAKKVDNVTTILATSPVQGLAVNGAVFEVVLAGSSVTVKCNGSVAIPTQTITEQAANTKHGFYFRQTALGMAWDDASFTPA